MAADHESLQGEWQMKPSRTWKTPGTEVPRAWDAHGSMPEAEAAKVEQNPKEGARRLGGGPVRPEKALQGHKSAREDEATRITAGGPGGSEKDHKGVAIMPTPWWERLTR